MISGTARKSGSPTESEIAAVAYRLWLERGCPDGSDREDWFLAEALLQDALVVKRPPASCCDPHAGSEILAGFPWEGHWEVWEREWVSAHWVWDVRHPRVEAGKAA